MDDLFELFAQAVNPANNPALNPYRYPQMIDIEAQEVIEYNEIDSKL